MALVLGPASWALAGIAAVAGYVAQPRSYALKGVEQRIPAPEARQGVASDGRYVYAIDNSRIGKYAIASGGRVASWIGDPKLFPHLNSCTIVGRELACAASNYPALPQASSVEFFDASQLGHVRSVSLGPGPGWLTAMDWHDGQWWAVFANYDGHGRADRDHKSTLLVRMDDAFRRHQAWTFPPSILKQLAPNSASGASWTAGGRLTVTGHSRSELYIVEVPKGGTVLKHVATIAVATPGQAIDWDPGQPNLLWSIDRRRKQIISSRPKL